MAERAAIPPTDRSMPPVRITNVCPMAMMPMAVTCQRTLRRLPAVRKFGETTLRTTHSSASAPSIASSTR